MELILITGGIRSQGFDSEYYREAKWIVVPLFSSVSFD